jgi:hypothetical protein
VASEEDEQAAPAGPPILLIAFSVLVSGSRRGAPPARRVRPIAQRSIFGPASALEVPEFEAGRSVRGKTN